MFASKDQLCFSNREKLPDSMAGMATGQRYLDKVVIVTGGTRGIGEGIVREFVRQGAKVVFCAPGCEEERGQAIQKELKDSGGSGECHFHVCDVLSESDIKTLVLVTIERYGRLDCLVNNAGGHPPDQTIDEVTAQEFHKLLNLNVVSCFLTAKFALPYLRKTKGNIINLASLVSIIGQKCAVPYVATKGAVAAMTKAMAIDESKYGVRVNRIPLISIPASLQETSGLLGGRSSRARQLIRRPLFRKAEMLRQLLGRMGTPAEVAAAALYLASDAMFCTGINLVLSGGAELAYAQKCHAGASFDLED
ncbi:hypothetical protein lerEdw1_007034 [Lerista edwardsae]|nr:hypothetical protein lerEdw1_007034 [Lerista edwardsae]